jgi:hypothetical protein
MGQPITGCSKVERLLFFWLAICTLVCTNAAYAQDQEFPSQEGIVLIIANENYDGSSWTRLRNPVNDARIIKNRFEQIGFNVQTPAVNLRKDLLDIRIREFRETANKLPKRSLAIIYYTGHGIQVDGTNYLVPIGAPAPGAADTLSSTARAEWLRNHYLAMNDLLRAFGKNRDDEQEGANLLILDACRTNPWEQRSKGTSPGKGLADIPIIANTLIAFSAAPGTTADDGSGDNSPYAKAIYQQLSRTNIPLELIFSEISFSVIEATRTANYQRPDYRFALSRSFCLKYCDGRIFASSSNISPRNPDKTNPSETICDLCVEMSKIRIGERELMISNVPISLDIWRMCAKELACKDVGEKDDDGRLPATGVSWDDVMKFLDWSFARHGKKYRLFSKEEWNQLLNNLPSFSRTNHKSIRPLKSDLKTFGNDYLGMILEWTSSCYNQCKEHIVVGSTFKNLGQSLLSEFSIPNAAFGDELGFRVVQDITQ